MNIKNFPEDEKDIINIAAKAGYLKVETELGDVKLNSYNEVELQLKKNPFGAKIKVNQDGSVSPTLTFDTKKLRDPKKHIDAKQMLDDALEKFLNETGEDDVQTF